MAYLLKTNPAPQLVETPDNRFVVGGPNDSSVVPPNLRGGIIPGVDDVVDSVKDVVDDYEKGYELGDNGAAPATDSSSVSNPAATVDSLNQYLNDLGGQLSSWKDFYDLMNKIYAQTGAEDFVSGDSARLAITEKIADLVYNFTSTLYSNAFQSQMWYEQQEYNSPSQQLHRLADAGLLGMWSQVNSGNALSSANASPVSQVGESDAASIQQQAKQARMERIMSGIGLSLEFASLGMQGFQAATDFGVKAAQKELITTQSANIKAMQIPHILNLVANTAKTGSEIGVNRQMAQYKGQEVANAIRNTENTMFMWQNDYNQRATQFAASQSQERDLTTAGFETQKQVAAQNNAASIRIAQMNNDKAEELANNFEWVEDGYFMYTGENKASGKWVSSSEVTDMMEKTANGDFSVGSKTLGMDLGLSGSLKGTDVLKELRSTDFGESVKVGNTTFVRQSRTTRMTLKEAQKRQKAVANADKHNLGPFPSQYTNPVSNQIFIHNQNNLNQQSAKYCGFKSTAALLSGGPR